MIIDNHDGYVAQTRTTVDEAQFLINCIDSWLANGGVSVSGVDAGHVRQLLTDIVEGSGA